ncbi:lipid-A-disaccharide synthase [Methylophaga sp. OBS4]|uniref:lipid-A-disaccharide synthase n=1 Tax=Methylophaga sp. OBS4 TaxID=2991935 RepID=UPI00225BCFF4|nr:lipid-A-disaccharide synthase [Methylophaga sp. OBS4]MCX4187972.1 lipid-A-disaccharide synthase [Methylophaga sp. OBS4]
MKSPATPHRPQRRALIVTGEASGDLHGGNLVRAARRIDPELVFFGVGGNSMAAAGCDILISSEELAVMGIVEVIEYFPVIYRALQRLKKIIHGPERPDLLILIDFPEFNLRLARQAQKAGIPVLYYISPQIWAWRQGRAKKIARLVDRMAVILPFEADFYRGYDIDVSYVGNPLLEDAQVRLDKKALLSSLGLDAARPVIGLFPGSRRNELRYIFDTIVDAAELIRQRCPEVQFLLPVASSLDPEIVREKLSQRNLPVTLTQANIYDVANACCAAITVSGTVTLQTALVGTPMAVVYKMAPLTYAIGKRLVKIPFISLANIVAGRGVVREFIQDAATPTALADEIIKIIEDSAYAEAIRGGLLSVRKQMGEKGCSERVARMASEMSAAFAERNGSAG